MRKRYTPEQVVGKLREAEADLANGLTIAQVCQKLAISEQTYHRWPRKDGPSGHVAARRPGWSAGYVLCKEGVAEAGRLPALQNRRTASDRPAGRGGGIRAGRSRPCARPALQAGLLRGRPGGIDQGKYAGPDLGRQQRPG
jgi:hypothetical protein